MFCSNCGGKLDQEVKFCSYCGKEMSTVPKATVQETLFTASTPNPPMQQPADATPRSVSKNRKGKYILFALSGIVIGAILLAAIFFATGMLSSDVKTLEGPGFSTPEDAAKAYLTGLRDQDINAMISAFAIESYVDNYDFEASVERIQTYQMYADIFLPNTSDYTVQLNIAARRNQITRLINMQYMLYNTPEELNDGTPVTFSKDDTAAIQDFVAKFEQDTNNYIFEDLEITGTVPPEDLAEAYMDERNQQNIAKQAVTFGADADDVVNVAITFEADGQTWVFCPQLVRYDSKWYIQSSQGNLAVLLNMSAYTGGIAPY